MIFHPTLLPGVYRLEPEPLRDERGFFARTFCAEEFTEHGLEPRVVQCNVSFNHRRGTLRGMHYQETPAEAKLVRCTRGQIFDVALDLRPESPTYKRWVGFALSAENRQALYIPPGCAHGFLTLEDDTEVFYQMSEFYSAPHARGVRYDDPAFDIRWPEPVRVIHQRDRTYPDFEG